MRSGGVMVAARGAAVGATICGVAVVLSLLFVRFLPRCVDPESDCVWFLLAAAPAAVVALFVLPIGVGWAAALALGIERPWAVGLLGPVAILALTRPALSASPWVPEVVLRIVATVAVYAAVAVLSAEERGGRCGSSRSR